MKYNFLFGLLFTAIMGFGMQDRPNIVVILTDDQGWGDLGFTGNPYLKTPNIDNLARQGVFFSAFYVSPVCSPTRAELLTGRYYPRSGVYSTSQGGERIDLDEILFPQVLQNAGYITGLFGKWHSGQQHPYHPNSRGFDEFYGYCSGHLGSYFNSEIEHNGRLIRSSGYLTDDLTDKAISFVEVNKDRPFMLFLSLNTPHSPMQVPDAWWQKFSDMDILEAKDEKAKNHARAAYAMVENVDWNVGRLMKKLQALGLVDNSIVFFLSDNGPNGNRWNDNLKGIKGSTDEGGVRSPLAIYAPGTFEPAKYRQLAGAIDIAPTILELAGIHNSQIRFDGISLLPMLRGSEVKDDRVLFNYWNGKLSVRTNKFRLSSENELFDIENDPGQTTPIQSDSVLSELMMRKENWIAEVADLIPKSDTRKITVTGKGFPTILPSREAILFGSDLKLSNKWPNDSFIMNWTSDRSYIYWPVEVFEAGWYQAVVYYTADSSAKATDLKVMTPTTSGKFRLEHFESQLRGMEHDRVKREESYVKDFTTGSTAYFFLPAGAFDLKLIRKSKFTLGEVNIKRVLLKRL